MQKLPRKAAVIRGMVAAERGSAKAYVVFESKEAVEPALAMNMTRVGRQLSLSSEDRRL